jgi:hypothetical protein
MASRFMEMDAHEFAAGLGIRDELLDRAMAAANSILTQGDSDGPTFMVDRLEVVQAPAGFGAEQCQYRTVCKEVRVCEPDGICHREVRCFRECVG